MRINKERVTVDDSKIKEFWEHRVQKYNDDDPYAVTMLQDKDPDLARKRNEKEVEKLFPLLKLGQDSKVLDVACGIGRWSDLIESERMDILEYCGIDFNEGFIKIAEERNRLLSNRSFYVAGAGQMEAALLAHGKGGSSFNRILLMGILNYLNDEEVADLFSQVERICMEHAIICVREPVGIGDRLTLKDYFSEELKEDYNCIYRTRDELVGFFGQYLFSKGFCLQEEGWLFGKELNNRKETAQYYFIMER